MNGPIEQRICIVTLSDGRCLLASPSNPIESNRFYRSHHRRIHVQTPYLHVSYAQVPADIIQRLTSPKVLLVGLCHPENFPYPRFALGIADLAHAIRELCVGQVTFSDMQLGRSLDEIAYEIKQQRPDIVGVSITFGQQDLFEILLQHIEGVPDYHPTVIVGGTLAALDHQELLSRYSSLLVATGAGETTIQKLLEYWHHECKLEDIPGIAYVDDEGVIRRTEACDAATSSVIVPELDLLPDTLEQRGVMLLESSRGCAFSCSFCPRHHKGKWNGTNDDPERLAIIMPYVDDVFQQYRDLERCIFLVDEEFIGYSAANKPERPLEIARAISGSGFTFEVSARIDQVYRPQCDKHWHEDRIRLWKALTASGLSRALFGVESGVDSVLERFRKGTTSMQNVYAIRLLSACDIPLRLTYITFDPFMSLDELRATWEFQGRSDLMLRGNQYISDGDLFEAIHDDHYVEEWSRGIPFYREIPYMLVSLECLLGSRYLQEAVEAGLARETNLAMGKRQVEYVDWRIGVLSRCSRLWIDRNFALDYALKGLSKLHRGDLLGEIRASNCSA